ncbi:MAG: M48 family metallopeptidase [Desulfurivibrionaceae bacterium]
MPIRATLIFLICAFFLAGCENSDVTLITAAGIDAVKAVSLTDEDVVQLARESSRTLDSQQQIAPPENRYAERLGRLTREYRKLEGLEFNYKVYISDTVNAFAMADGTIRIYSQLMDMLDDDELRFVIGHEVGHVVKQHIKKKIRLAYAAKAIRKGVASQGNEAGAIAASRIGGFAESLLGAQFSQLEEKEADDYGLTFLESRGHDATAAIRALNKLAALGSDHTFLSSHPDPAARAVRLQKQLAGLDVSIDEKKQGVVDWLKDLYEKAAIKVRSFI